MVKWSLGLSVILIMGICLCCSCKKFEKITGVKLNYKIAPRRQGDVTAIYSNNDKARDLLGWEPQFNLTDMLATAWQWELKLKEDENLFNTQVADLN